MHEAPLLFDIKEKRIPKKQNKPKHRLHELFNCHIVFLPCDHSLILSFRGTMATSPFKYCRAGASFQERRISDRESLFSKESINWRLITRWCWTKSRNDGNLESLKIKQALWTKIYHFCRELWKLVGHVLCNYCKNGQSSGDTLFGLVQLLELLLPFFKMTTCFTHYRA